MSFLGFGKPQPTLAEKMAAAEQELEMITDMFNRLTRSCHNKCIPTDYKEADLNKGESVCLDRCVSKFFDVNIRVSEAMQSQSQAMRGAAQGGSGFGA